MDKLNKEYIEILAGMEIRQTSFGSLKNELRQIKKLVAFSAK